MSENVNENSVVDLDALFENENLRSLTIGSEEFNAELNKTSETDEIDDEPAVIEDSEEESENGDDEPAKKTKVRGPLKRIAELTAEKYELKKQIEELKAQKPQVNQEATREVSDVNTDKPDLEDFDTLADFTEALTDWKIQRLEEAREAKKQQAEIANGWVNRAKLASDKYSDYADFVNEETFNAADPSSEAKIFIIESEIGPEVVYHLMKNEDYLEKFLNATPIQQVKILTKLEVSLEGNQKSNQTSKAPSPASKLPKSKPVNTGKDLIKDAGSMSDAEWLKLRDEQRRNSKKR